jgi:nucleoid-associated protein YgaU
LFATFTHGQDLAEAARQERARKATQPKAPQHVYTNEDLNRQKILTPEDQARAEARRQQPDAAPTEQNAQQLPSEASPQAESLGEVARRYRQEKAARAAEQAAKKNFTPFPYKVPEDSFAVPKRGVAPRAVNSPGLDSSRRTTPMSLLAPHSSSRGNGPRARISPFQPRPLVVPPAEPPVVSKIEPRSLGVVRSAPVNPLSSRERAGMQRVQVQRGESWWKLAKRYLGSGAQWPELRRLNAEVNGPPELLKLGTIVLVPENGKMREGSTKRSITVKKGDSLWSLAREYFGRGSAWPCLANANPQILNYTYMRIGAPLQLPAGEALESCRSGKIHKLQK